MDNDQPDYSFMRAGLGSMDQTAISDSQLLLNVTSLVATFTENALIDASKYVEHAGRNVITREDIKLSLMAETFQFFDRDNIEQTIQKWKDIIDDDESFTSSDEDVEEELDEDPFTYSKCNCSLCTTINNIESRWCQWVPKEGIESILKNVVDTKFK